MATVKHKKRRENFYVIGVVSSSIITKWGSCLREADYYVKNFPCVTTIDNYSTGNGVLVSNCRDTVTQDSVADELISISRTYD